MSATQTLLNASLQYGAGSLTSHQRPTTAENSSKFLLALSQNKDAHLKCRDYGINPVKNLQTKTCIPSPPLQQHNPLEEFRRQ